MLSREQTIVEYDFQRRRIIPDRLTRQAHAPYIDHARRMIDLYQQGAGEARRDLHRQVERVLAEQPDCPSRRIAAFCKLLDSESRYGQGGVDAARLRRTVFRAAAKLHPLQSAPNGLFGTAREEACASIANELGRPWEEIEQELFADVIDYHRLESYHGPTEPEDLLARYNVAQTQATLYDAIDLTVWTESDLQRILRAAKLSGLMHHIVRQQDGVYCFRFNGPASIVRETRRYGVAMAKFLPVLIACHSWKLLASIQPKQSRHSLHLALDCTDGLRSHLQADDLFDSEIERKLAEKWGPLPRTGWRLSRDERILHEGQTVYTPDFLLQHVEDSRLEIFVEILGFWTTEYLREKLKRLSQFNSHLQVLLLPESRKEDLPSAELHPNMRLLTYKTAIRVDSLIRVADELRNYRASRGSESVG